MSAVTANHDAGICNAMPITRIGQADRRPAKDATALLVIVKTGAKVYGVAVLLKFPVPSFAVTVVASGADLASGRQ